MAVTVASTVTLNRLLNQGGLTVFNDAFTRNGRGQRGTAAAENAIRRLFPGVGQQTLDALAARAKTARDIAGRQKRAGDTYVTPKAAHTEINCARRAPPGSARRRIYQYTVVVPVEFTDNSGLTITHNYSYTLEFTSPAALGVILNDGRNSATAEANFKMQSPTLARRGIADFSVGTPQITGSFTCLT